MSIEDESESNSSTIDLRDQLHEAETSEASLLYVDALDVRFSQAITAGAKEKKPIADQFYGDRSGTLVDPSDAFGPSQRTRRI